MKKPTGPEIKWLGMMSKLHRAGKDWPEIKKFVKLSNERFEEFKSVVLRAENSVPKIEEGPSGLFSFSRD